MRPLTLPLTRKTIHIASYQGAMNSLSTLCQLEWGAFTYLKYKCSFRVRIWNPFWVRPLVWSSSTRVNMIRTSSFLSFPNFVDFVSNTRRSSARRASLSLAWDNTTSKASISNSLIADNRDVRFTIPPTSGIVKRIWSTLENVHACDNKLFGYIYQHETKLEFYWINQGPALP